MDPDDLLHNIFEKDVLTVLNDKNVDVVADLLVGGDFSVAASRSVRMIFEDQATCGENIMRATSTTDHLV